MIPNYSIDVRPVSGGVGAEISGVDLRDQITDQTCLDIQQALNDYGVIFFRGQELTPEAHIAFAERFGAIHQSPFLEHVRGYPAIAEVRKETDQTRNIGGYWHTDQSYDQAPSMGSILLAREVPRSGGDTLFASMTTVYDGLSDGLKKTLESLRAVHCNSDLISGKRVQDTLNKTGGGGQALKEAIHPVVIRHPKSGRATLYVNPYYTIRFEGWTQSESAPLLCHLYEQVMRPENTYRFQWQPGSIAFWDNRSTWHYAVNDYDGDRRVMHRVTLKGVPLEAAV
ncbi:MAG: taurine dioxygenase [Rhodospirillales bacterium]|jgi:taurine dioxygenase|nr:taurine dioxygenase [Rhodospirillales bacterium]